jgi:hypothetical protein
MTNEPQDDNVGEPEGTVSGTHEPSLWSRLTRRLRWWFNDRLKDYKRHREVQAALKTLRHGSEKELRDLDMPGPRSDADLRRIIDAVAKRQHDYGTCVYAMSIAAEAAYNYISHVLGVTGFQASCADMDFLRRTRGWKMGFQILNYENLLYPQYADKFPTRAKMIQENIDQLGKEAEKKLAETERAHPEVRRWWEDLVDMRRIHLSKAQP